MSRQVVKKKKKWNNGKKGGNMFYPSHIICHDNIHVMVMFAIEMSCLQYQNQDQFTFGEC